MTVVAIGLFLLAAAGWSIPAYICGFYRGKQAARRDRELIRSMWRKT